MNEVSKLIKNKSGQNVRDFIEENFSQKYHAYVASVVTGSFKVRDIIKVMDKTGVDADTIIKAFKKSYKGQKVKIPKFTKTAKSVNNPFLNHS